MNLRASGDINQRPKINLALDIDEEDLTFRDFLRRNKDILRLPKLETFNLESQARNF
jgi:hypothetical protein